VNPHLSVSFDGIEFENTNLTSFGADITIQNCEIPEERDGEGCLRIDSLEANGAVQVLDSYGGCLFIDAALPVSSSGAKVRIHNINARLARVNSTNTVEVSDSTLQYLSIVGLPVSPNHPSPAIEVFNCTVGLEEATNRTTSVKIRGHKVTIMNSLFHVRSRQSAIIYLFVLTLSFCLCRKVLGFIRDW
jgi:hypothetical protein